MGTRYPNKKKFNGKTYQLKGVSDIRHSVEINAEHARLRGHNARVVKMADGRWGLYIRK